jgi:restriction system protein
MRGYRRLLTSANRVYAAAARAEAQAARQAVAAERGRLRALAQHDKNAMVEYLRQRAAEADELRNALRVQERELSEILTAVKPEDHAVDFRKMRVRANPIAFDANGLDIPEPEPQLESFLPAPLGMFKNLFPWVVDEHQHASIAGRNSYARAMTTHAQNAAERERQLKLSKAAHIRRCEVELLRAEWLNREVNAFEAGYKARQRTAVIKYFQMVLAHDVVFQDSAPVIRVEFTAESRQLVVEYELPTIDAIPAESDYKYVKKSDTIETVARKANERRTMYRSVIAQLVCRVLRVVHGADLGNAVSVIVVNGFVDTTNPATGKNVKPTIISVRATAAELDGIDFDRVDAAACLASLRAIVSRSAHELEPVRPIVNFNMLDPRFIEKSDVLSGLDVRRNIAELSPSEFENLMTNLFEKMGLETRLTQASRDGGVDCVAWDMRPVIGGKVVIQAKRYRNTVGVSAVRDLYGTMMNEGAAKGILVTTSGFGQSAYEFAKNKPIELITGSNLLSMLAEYAQVDAKTDFPSTWQDFKEDSAEVRSAPS